MAGMLPGVESARRRRLSGWCDPSSVMNSGFGSARTTRHSNDAYVKPTSCLQRSMVNQLDDDDKLGGVAREAKERLDGRLRGHLKKEITRQSSQERLTGVGRRPTASSVMLENLQMEVYGLKKNGLKRLSWGRMGLSWKSSKQDGVIHVTHENINLCDFLRVSSLQFG